MLELGLVCDAVVPVAKSYSAVCTRYQASPLARYNASNPWVSNIGWQQGVMNAALLGLAHDAMAMALQRAWLEPAPGARWIGFSQHLQDSEPSADHLATMNSALNWMLLQPAHDGLGNASVALLPAWPCEWSIRFKLHAPRSTVIELDYAGGNESFGELRSLVVSPPARRDRVKFLRCIPLGQQ